MSAITMDNLLNHDETAEHLRIRPITLYQWRQRHYGPAWVKIGKRVYYDRAEIDRWINEQKEGV